MSFVTGVRKHKKYFQRVIYKEKLDKFKVHKCFKGSAPGLIQAGGSLPEKR